ncbi:hypothetical protein J6590_046408 [Homalodisca vitripennis]|nr:hypothetical protein J6590_046408 [Homalodisca vitripennis]
MFHSPAFPSGADLTRKNVPLSILSITGNYLAIRTLHQNRANFRRRCLICRQVAGSQSYLDRYRAPKGRGPSQGPVLEKELFSINLAINELLCCSGPSQGTNALTATRHDATGRVSMRHDAIKQI